MQAHRYGRRDENKKTLFRGILLAANQKTIGAREFYDDDDKDVSYISN